MVSKRCSNIGVKRKRCSDGCISQGNNQAADFFQRIVFTTGKPTERFVFDKQDSLQYFRQNTITKKREGQTMKESVYKSYEELPIMLNAETLAKVLGIAPSSAYELMHEKEFPTLRIGNRIVVPKEKFIEWVQKRTEGERG